MTLLTAGARRVLARPVPVVPKIGAGRRAKRAMRAAVLLAILATGWADVRTVTDGQTVEYEQREQEGWRWFLFPTNDTGGVSCGLVLQRGENDNFPRHGFVVLASTGVVPPGSVSAAEYNPKEYDQHEHLVGPRFQYNWIDKDTSRPNTDWSVLTLGYDTNASAAQPAATQVPLANVLIGFKCNEANWQGETPGCRYSITVRLVPFVLKHGLSIQAPMSPRAKAQASAGARIGRSVSAAASSSAVLLGRAVGASASALRSRGALGWKRYRGSCPPHRGSQ